MNSIRTGPSDAFGGREPMVRAVGMGGEATGSGSGALYQTRQKDGPKMGSSGLLQDGRGCLA